MRNLFNSALLLAAVTLVSCGDTGDKSVASNQGAASFDSLIKALPDEQILDVRTPQEFGTGHIEGATNIDWNGQTFAIDVGVLDKTKPVLVYCRSGRRSAEAAKYLRTNGFPEVIELEGGIAAWQSAGLSITAPDPHAATEGPVSLEQYNKVIADNKVVLVDFTATWCGPCKILAPSLHELETELKDKFVLLKVDVDRDRPVAEHMNIAAMPTLVLYKDGQIQWRNEGLVPKEMVAEKINSVQ